MTTPRHHRLNPAPAIELGASRLTSPDWSAPAPVAPIQTLYSGFNVGGADWPRPELVGVADVDERLRRLRQIGFNEARLAHQSGGNLLRTFLDTRRLGLFDAQFHLDCYAEKEPVYQVELDQRLARLDRVAEQLAQAQHGLATGMNVAGQPLNWANYDAWFAGMADFNASLTAPNAGIRILLTLVEQPPRLLIECPPKHLLAGRSYTFASLWSLYLDVMSRFILLVVRRYVIAAASPRPILQVTAMEMVNEPDYTWLPDELRIERSLNPQCSPCDKYITELHLSQVPENDLPNKPVAAAPWGFQSQALNEAAVVEETPLAEFRWGTKFDLYVKCFADFHARLTRDIHTEVAAAGQSLDLVAASVTHNNLDWLVRMHRANPATFKHCNKIGIHPYHWPQNDIWDQEFVSGRDGSDWREVSPRKFAAEYFKRFDFLEELSRLVRLTDEAESHGLAGKQIWVTEFGIPTKKLCPANLAARTHQRLFIYQRGEPVPADLAAICWEDKWDAFFEQVDAGYLARHAVETFLFYTLREGLTSESSDANHSNFSLYRSPGTPRLEAATQQRLQHFLKTVSSPNHESAMNTTLTAPTPSLGQFPGMTTVAERQYLFNYAASTYRGAGEIVDLGSWLGSLTVPLLQGLAQNPHPGASRKAVHAYDIFIWKKWMDPYQQHELIQGRYQEGDSFLPEFVRLVQPWDRHESLLIYAGDLCKMNWSGQPIELLVVDAMKGWELANHIIHQFYPALVPNQSQVFHQDYCHFFEYWIHLIQFRLRNHFTLVADLRLPPGWFSNTPARSEPALLAAEYNDAQFPDDEVDAAFAYSLSIVKDRAKHPTLHAAKVMAWIKRNNLPRAELTLTAAVAAGFPIEGELKTVADLLAQAQAKAASQAAPPAAVNGHAAAVVPPGFDHSRIIAEAVAACERGDEVAARRYFAAARVQKLKNCNDAVALGYVALNLGEDAAVLDCFTTAVRLDGGHAPAHSGRALILQLLGQTAEAQLAAEAALRLDANDLVALKVQARINIDAHRLVEGQAYCRQVLRLNPQDADAKTMLLQCDSPAPAVVPVPRPAPVAPTAPEVASEKLRKLEGLMGDYAARCEAWENLGVEHLTQQLVVGDFKKAIAISSGPAARVAGADGLPVPPAGLTMGYGAGNLDHYLACGRKSYESLTGLLRQQAVELGRGDAMLDWGGAAGRVVRNFTAEAQRGCEVWGCDVHAPSIQWAQDHLSPPFKFFNSSALPSLPFPDGHFKFIYGLSVFTHLIALRDLWLLELRRVLRPDGCLILTVHNESTWEWFRTHQPPPWLPAEFRALAEMPGECIDIRGSRWEHCYTFFSSAYLRRVWGQFFRVADIVPCAEGYQTAVVLRKIEPGTSP